MAITLVGSSGVTGSATNGGSVTLTFATAPSAGDIALVWNVTTATSQPAQTVLSGSGAAFTLLNSTSNGGNLRTSLWYLVCKGTETTATCSGTSAAADATAAGAFVFRGASPYTTINLSARQNGTSSTPNPPIVKANHAGDGVVAIAASLANSGAAVTPPSGYLNLIWNGATDTRSCQIGMSWVTSTNNNNTPLSYDPTAYSSFTSAGWVAFTASITSTDPYTPFDLQSGGDTLALAPYKGVEVVAYG